jgi:membrane-associated phospholipid phosphatase
LLQSKQYANFRLALFFSLLLCIIVGAFLAYYGRTQSFLLINGAHNPALDVFFQYCTFLGDGIIYIPLLCYCIFFNRAFTIPVVLGILICLLLTHVLKRIVFPEVLRPVSLEAQHYVLHKIKSVRINRLNSFPSGHTATAFSTALLLVMVLKEKIWAFLLPLLTLLVGYSRVYLAQHFVSDVLGGMLIGMVTAVVALWLQPKVLAGLPASLQQKLKQRETAAQ